MTLASPASEAKSFLGLTALRRPELPGWALNMLVALFIMAAYNKTFWQRGFAIFDGHLPRLAVFGVAIWALTLLTLAFFGFRWLQKPVLAGLLILSAVTSYYTDTLGVMIDRDMIQNVMKTTVNESKHLVTLGFVANDVFWGLLPAAVVMWIKVRPRPFWRDLMGWAATVVFAFALLVGALFSDFKAYSAVLREHKELIGSYQPGAPISGTFRYAKLMMRSRNIVVAPLGRDAVKGPLLSAAKKPVLTVLFTGETARAQNFGLNGYERDTSPELAARNVINFPDVSSCGTATAVSVPCMYSQFGRSAFSHEKGIGNENLLDVLHHAGIEVEWWDNNTGHQGNAKRLPNRMMSAQDDPEACATGECTDQVFLDLLAGKIDGLTEDTVLVLHMIGSHGPAYFLRYPPEFERFTPACQTPEFAKCTSEEIRNAYDNTMLYSDHILAQTIDMLSAQDKVIPAMFYVSDHGESLGEDGLYLHGAPYFMAPETQTRVPMVMWMSDEFKQTMALDEACLRDAATRSASHDNVFHSILGLMDVTTGVRDDALDIVGACRLEISG